MPKRSRSNLVASAKVASSWPWQRIRRFCRHATRSRKRPQECAWQRLISVYLICPHLRATATRKMSPSSPETSAASEFFSRMTFLTQAANEQYCESEKPSYHKQEKISHA